MVLINIDHLKALVDEGKVVSLSKVPDDIKNKGKMMCQIESKDAEYFMFAETIEELFEKLKRRELLEKRVADMCMEELGE
jgi:hypothetical protein